VLLPALAHANASSSNGRIAFSEDGTNGLSQVFTVNPNGTGVQQITHGPLTSADGGLSWSPNGRGLLFVEFQGGGGDQIYKSRADGSGLKLVSPRCTGACDDSDPVYSPDGKRIAFERAWETFPTGSGSASAIFTMNPDGTELTQLTHTAYLPTTSEDSQPVWSPDGKKIAFVRTTTLVRPSNESAIMVMNADGSHIRRLTPFNIDAGDPHWSPDGKRILFNTYALRLGGQRPPAQSANLYTMRPDGTRRVALTHYTGGVLQAFAEDWSPNGSQILFNRVTYSGTDASAGGFYIMNLRTRHTRRLTLVRTNAGERAAWGRSPS
jgi:Tol biopolymer transport system component